MTTPAQPTPVSSPAAVAPPAAPPASPTPPPVPPPPGGREIGPDEFPQETPLAQMTADQQASYWRDKARKHEAAFKSRGDYDDLKLKAAEADRLRQQVETDAEKAVREATEQARKATLDEIRPRLVAAEFRAASAGRIEADRLATLTEDIDMSRYLKADGTVDLDKVTAKVDAWAPKPPPPDPNAPPPPPRGVKPDPSQGSRGGKASGMDAGRDRFDERRGKRPGVNAS